MIRFVIAALAAASLSADDQRIVLDPPGPTSATAIVADLYVTCDPMSYTVDRVGNVIKIHVTPGRWEPVCDPPIAAQLRVPIGTLAAGEYRIDATVGERDSVDSRSFVVRNGEESVIDVHPFALPAEPFGLSMRLTAGDLAVAKVFVDDVRVNVTRVENGVYWFTAPAHARGLVDVKIETESGATHTLKGALYYYDYTSPLDTSVFERILFPVLQDAAGAYGSHWVSEVAIANTKPWFIDTYNAIFPFVCLGSPCGERLTPEFFLAFNGYRYPRGVALLAPRAEADNLAFSLRVRDTSRAAEGYGTQVPVVREHEMFRGTALTLLNVPTDVRYRVKLRVYAFETTAHDAEVTVHRVSEPNVIAARYFVPVRRDCAESGCDSAPWYAEFDLPSSETGEPVNVYITVGSQSTLAWAFASITNNATQQVTIVTANGSGGRP